MSEKISPCMTGDQITSETILRAHFSAGGIVQIAGVEKWYRMPTTQLLALKSTSSDWTDSFRELCELVRNEKVIACDEPELSREIRGDAERERQREEDNEQVRRDVGAPKISTNAKNARCIAPNGYQFPIGEELRLHLNEGGFVQVDYRDKWYRARANKQEVLYGTRAEWEPASWDWDDMARMNVCIACDEPQLSKDIRAREEADAERNARKFMRAFDEASGPPFKEKQMLYRDDGNDVSAHDEYAMMFHIYNDSNRQVVFVMTCGENSQTCSFGLMEAAKLHAALGVWLDQASEAEAWRFANNNSQRVVIGGNYEAPKKRVEDSEMVREFDGSFSGALDLMATGSCCTIKGEHPKKYYIIDAWGTLKAHDGDGLWSAPWLTREMMRGKWEFFSDKIPYGPIGESEARK